MSRRRRRIAGSGHAPDAHRARPRGLVAPLEEVCLQPEAGSAICVQRFDDSLNSAIRTTYRISLRSSSLREPRYPSAGVVCGVHTTRERQPGPLGRGRRSGFHPPKGRGNTQTRTGGCGVHSKPRETHSHGKHAARASESRPRKGHDQPREMPNSRDGAQRCGWKRPVMILPQVHLRKPCYDFSFL